MLKLYSQTTRCQHAEISRRSGRILLQQISFARARCSPTSGTSAYGWLYIVSCKPA